MRISQLFLQFLWASLQFEICLCGILSFFSKDAVEKAVSVEQYLRGVPLKIHNIYSAETFTCDAGKLTLNRSQINDNYCDCLDGQDEPGTSACANGVFYCINRGYRMLKMPTSRVDDGICDCCDGSDEGIVANCPNACLMAAANERAKTAKLQAAYDKGSKIRERLLLELKDKNIKKTKQLEELKANEARLKTVVEELREIRDREEEQEETEKTTKKGEVVMKVTQRLGDNLLRLDLLAKLLAALFDTLHYTEHDVVDAIRSLSQTSPNGDDENKEESVPVPPPDDAYGDNEDADVDAYGSEGSGDESHADASDLPPAPDCILTTHSSDSRLRRLCASAHDETSLRNFLVHVVRARKATNELQLLWGYLTAHGNLDGASQFARDLLYPSPTEGESDEEAPPVPAADTCPALLAPFPGACTLAEDVSALLASDVDHKRSEADSARSAYNTAESEHRQAKSSMRDTERDLRDVTKYEDKLAFLALKGKCVEGKDGKFTYKLCMMEHIEQSALEEDTVRLGKFDSFFTDDGGSVLKMSFKDGQYCHAFGPRTAEVEVTCGAENVLRDAREPSTCFYSFKLETPAACSPQFAEMNGLY